MPLKNRVLFIIMLVGSGYFLYQGFSLLFHPQKVSEKSAEANLTQDAK